MSDVISVLDHGHVRLVEHMGSDLSIARNARISYDAEWRAGEDKGSDTRLIRYLYRNGHTSPFESVVFTFDVKAPLFVVRQWQRHRTQSYNEISARYRELPDEMYIPDKEVITKQSEDNKQMRSEELVDNPEVIRELIESTNKESFAAYKELIRQNCPRELARSVLPVGIYSHMFTTVNLNNLFKFIAERTHEHAQYEIRVYAHALLELIEPIVPVAVAAFKEKMNENC